MEDARRSADAPDPQLLRSWDRSPEQRNSAGKSPAGRIHLSARQERGQIVIEIRDDGRGIDLQAIERKAVEQGVKRTATSWTA